MRLTGSHAEYIAGQLVEPGEEVPEDADEEQIDALRDAGRLLEDAPKRSKKED